MILDTKIIGIRSYLVHVATMKDGVAGLEMLYDLLRDSPSDFSIGVVDDNGSENGWAIDRIGDRFLFQFVCLTPVNGFLKGHGSIYCYKIGNDPEKHDWPSVEFGKVPKHCLLTASQIEPLLTKLYHSDNPGQSDGFTYSPECWELVC